MPKGFKGTGYVSKVRTPNHQFFKWSQWWSSEEAFEEYRRDQNQKRKMNRHGYELHQVEKFREMETEARDLIAERKRHDHRVRLAMQQIRKKYNMDPHTHRGHFKALYLRTGDPDVKLLLNMISTAPLIDTQKLERIRQMFLDKKSPADILYTTALMVGINLRKTQ